MEDNAAEVIRNLATLSKAKERQDNPNNDDQTHQIDQTVHDVLLIAYGTSMIWSD